MAQRHSNSDDDMEFGDEDFSGGDSIIIRLGNSSWGGVAGQDSEDEDDVETMRNNPLALLLQWFNRSSRITRSQTAQQTRLPLYSLLVIDVLSAILLVFAEA